MVVVRSIILLAIIRSMSHRRYLLTVISRGSPAFLALGPRSDHGKETPDSPVAFSSHCVWVVRKKVPLGPFSGLQDSCLRTLISLALSGGWDLRSRLCAKDPFNRRCDFLRLLELGNVLVKREGPFVDDDGKRADVSNIIIPKARRGISSCPVSRSINHNGQEMPPGRSGAERPSVSMIE